MSAARVLSGFALLLVATAASADNALLERLQGMEDGKVQIEFEAREGVWGDGRSIMTFSDDDDIRYSRHSSRRLEPGPVRVLFTIRDGEVTHLKTRVGGSSSLSTRAEDLGRVDATVAAEALMFLARNARTSVAEDAIGAAVLAADVELWSDLLEVARDRGRANDVRESAIFWLGQARNKPGYESLLVIINDEGRAEKERKHSVY